MTAFTYAELFAGAGGLSMGLETAGWEPVAHAEIEPHARAVLREHWPDCRLDGDVSQVNGGEYAGVTLLSGGSPCQDLSVAGKRAGMTEGSGTRSSLFFEQVRIWHESGAPYFLWENVLGAFSSNNGRDFAAVLSALVGAAISVPADGWQSAGVAAGPTGVAAWRVLDCQFFGPPQRRRRVFVLGARAGGVDPDQVLSDESRLFGHLETRGQSGQEPTRDAGNRARAAGEAGGRDVRGVGGAVANTLSASRGRGGSEPERGGNVVVAMDAEYNASDRVMGPLDIGSKSGGGRPTAVVSFAQNQRGELRTMDVAAQLTTGGGKPGEGYAAVLTYDARGNGDGATVNTMAGDHQNRVTDYTAIVVRQADDATAFHATQDPISGSVSPALGGTSDGMAVLLRNREGKPGGGKGPLLSEEKSLTLGTGNDQVLFTMATAFKPSHYTRGKDGAPTPVAMPLSADADRGDQEQVVVAPAQTFRMVAFGEYSDDGTASAIKARDFKDATDLAVGGVGIPRRLMPIETERLMGWPDNWTQYGVAEDGTRYALSDTARYRLCGNGVASPVAAWIGWRLRWAIEAQAAG